jgi:chemotaxis protein MotB
MRINNLFLIGLICLISLASCVSGRKFKNLKKNYEDLNYTYTNTAANLSICKKETSSLLDKKKELEDQIEELKNNKNQVIKQLEDLSVITTKQAESIKVSLDNIGSKDNYIQNLQQQISRKDSLNMSLVMNLKSSLAGMSDKDIDIKIEKGVIYIDISDKILFKSGEYYISRTADTLLGRIARILKSQPDVEFMVEGHTDNAPYSSGILLDNWDLSVKRATSVVRILQYVYGLNPANMVAAGRSEYKPIAPNIGEEEKSLNRRTRIIILPQLDQFFRMLEPKK